MDFINEFGFDVKKGEALAFQGWIRDHEKELASSAPEGWEYIGTYAAIVSSEKTAGDYRQLWRHGSYGAMDTWAETMSGGGRFAEMMDELASRFIDDDRGAGQSQTIMKSVAEVAIWGEGS